MEALLGVGRGQFGRKGKPARSGGELHHRGARWWGSNAVRAPGGLFSKSSAGIRKDTYKKRHKSLRIGEVLARISQEEFDERKKQAALLMIEMPLKMTAQSHLSFEGFKISSQPYVDLPPAQHEVLYDP